MVLCSTSLFLSQTWYLNILSILADAIKYVDTADYLALLDACCQWQPTDGGVR